MAASIPIEQESGTFTGRVHPHNGYYAGDFSTRWTSSRRTTRRPAQTSPSSRGLTSRKDAS
jgi:hypothetical protein